MHAVSNWQCRVNGSNTGLVSLDVCGHLDMQLVGSTKSFSCASRRVVGRFVHLSDC